MEHVQTRLSISIYGNLILAMILKDDKSGWFFILLTIISLIYLIIITFKTYKK